MKNLNLHPIKKLEIILAGEHQSFATDLLDRAGVKGYTIVNNLSGKGSHGFHACLLYTSPSPRDKRQSRMPSSA